MTAADYTAIAGDGESDPSWGMRSERLVYEPLSPAVLEEFHTLVQDDHVRRYLLDGAVHDVDWSRDRIADSMASFEKDGVGLWLVRLRDDGSLVGFCGFLVEPTTYATPQLVYAMFERRAGRGLATEMAAASIAHAREHGMSELLAAVDEVNGASKRVLEKVGFVHVDTIEGAFGPLHRLRLAVSAQRPS